LNNTRLQRLASSDAFAIAAARIDAFAAIIDDLSLAYRVR
jgi:hypothetical protein